MASSNLIDEYVNNDAGFSMNQPSVYLTTILLSFISTVAIKYINNLEYNITI